MKNILLSWLALSSLTLAVDETKEPPVDYTLKVEGKSYPVVEGKTFEIETKAGKSKAILEAKEYRVFPYQNISFHYPRHLTFEADLADASSLTWMMSGNDVILMVFSIEGDLSATDMADSLKLQYGSKNTKVSKETVSLGGTKYEAVRLEVNLVGTTLCQKVLKLKSAGGRTLLLVLQDSLNDEGKHTREFDAAVKMLGETLKLKED
jgi:hypothetical protein